MLKKVFPKFLLIMITILFSLNLYAENIIDDSYVLLGVGLGYQKYSGQDEFREASGLFGDKDELKYAIGLQLNAELLLNKTLGLDLPVGLGIGYKLQSMGSTITYSTLGGDNIDKKVDVINNIGYASIYLPLGEEKYWVAGCSAGVGVSKYTISMEGTNPAYIDTTKASNGTVIPLSVFLDWGADGVGARFGYTYIISDYPEINGSGSIPSGTPKGNGHQFFLDFRYAI